MIPTPTEVLARIKDGSLLPPAVIAALDHDSILDERDSDAEFEAQWMRCYDAIEDGWQSAGVEQELSTLKDDIRRESFLSVSRATAQHEIASYVSDDFDELEFDVDYYEYTREHPHVAFRSFFDQQRFTEVRCVPLLAPNWPPYESNLRFAEWHRTTEHVIAYRKELERNGHFR